MNNYTKMKIESGVTHFSFTTDDGYAIVVPANYVAIRDNELIRRDHVISMRMNNGTSRASGKNTLILNRLVNNGFIVPLGIDAVTGVKAFLRGEKALADGLKQLGYEARVTGSDGENTTHCPWDVEAVGNDIVMRIEHKNPRGRWEFYGDEE